MSLDPELGLGEFVIPLTRAMLRTLDFMAQSRTSARVVGVRYGLPLLRYPAGQLVILTTTGKLERVRCER